MGIPESENGEALVRDCAIATLESYGMPPKGLGKRCSNYSASGYGWSGILNFPNFPQLVRQEKPDNNFIKYKFWDISDPASPDLHCIGEGEVASLMDRRRSLRCPDGFLGNDGMVESANIKYCYRYTEQESMCPAADASAYQDGLFFGNPVAVATGEKFQIESDWNDPSSLDSLSITRLYRSDWANLEPGLLDGNWHLSQMAYLHKVVEGQRAIRLPDGSLRRFEGEEKFTGPVLWQPSNHPNTLYRTENRYIYIHSEDSSQWYFNNDGLLLEVKKSNGWTRTYIYDEDRLLKITNHFGRSLIFSYDSSHRVSKITTPDGGFVSYSYDGFDSLYSATYPDGSAKHYHYINSPSGRYLSKIVDENGVTLSEFGYDAQGRATSTSQAGGANSYTLAYQTGAIPATFVTDPLQQRRDYWFSARNGVINVTSTSRVGLGGASARWRTVNEAGLVTQEMNSRGIVTKHEWDSARQQLLKTIEAVDQPEARTTSTTWHPQFRLPVTITEPGRATGYTYDSVGNPLSQTVTDSASGVSRTTSWTYHPSGLVATDTAPNGSVTSYGYDSLGNLTTATNSLGQTDSYTHDGAGRVLTHTAPTGLVTTYTYDARGRMLTMNRGGLQTTLTYRPSGQVATATLPHGLVVTYSYDVAQRLTGWSDNRGASANYVLDAMGNRTSEEVRDAQGQMAWKLARSINSLNRVASVQVGSAGVPTTYAYDANGDLTSATQTLANSAHTTTLTLDSLRRVKGLRDASNATAALTYDALDSVTKATDFKSVATIYTRDALGNAPTEASPDSGSQSATYDALGLPKQVTDALGRATTITRDALGRPTLLQYADNTSTTLRYDLPGAAYNAAGAPQASIGYLSEIQDPGVTTAFQRDMLGRITRKTQTLANGGLRSVTYSYHPAGSGGAGLLNTITYASGKQLAHVYDDTGQLTAMQWNGQPLVTGITWNPLGQPTGWQWPGFGQTPGNPSPLAEQRTYTDAGQLASSALLQLTWDGAGRIGNITQQYMLPTTSNTVAQQVGLSSAYTYDRMGRLTASAHSAPSGLVLPSGWSLSDVIGPNSMGYAYDANGNRTQAFYSTITPAGTATLQRTVQTTSGTNRISGYTQAYKPAGSTTSQNSTVAYQLDASGALTKKGDSHLHQTAQGRIAKVSLDANAAQAVSYVYNALSQRLLKSDARLSTTTPITEQAMYADDGIGSTVLGLYGNRRSTQSGATAGEPDSTEIIYLPTASGPMPIAAQINGRLYAIDSDHLNTPRRLTNTQGQVAWQWLITGFGEVQPTQGATGYALNGIDNGKVYSEAVSFNLRYPGQQWDEETGLSYNLNRYYDPMAGRYTQSDPIGLDGGWNRFAYVGSDPLNFADDEGLQRRAGGPATLSWGQAQLNFQGVSLTNQIRQYQPNYSYNYASAPRQGFTAANVGQLQSTLQRLQTGSVCTPNPQTGQGYGVNDPAVRISGSWSNADVISALRGIPPSGLGRPDLHHAGQMPGSAIHEILPHLHRGNTALHPNRYNQGVTPEMRSQDRRLHWWYRAQEQGAFQRFPNLIYD